MGVTVGKKRRFLFNQHGFLLIELLIGVIVFGFGMLLLGVSLFPMLSKSVVPHFEARASALGQSVMSQVVSGKFDRNSDTNGSRWRCDENALAVKAMGIATPEIIPACTAAFTKQSGLVAVEDYVGCWGENATACSQPYRGTLDQLVNGNVADYKGFSVNINVLYDDAAFINSSNNARLHKRVDIFVDVGKYGRYDFSSYRSNF